MSTYNLLLIDDDIDDQEIFLTALEAVSGSIGFTAISDAAEALQRLTTYQILPDLIFLDLNMPGMNGFQFLSEIKKIRELQTIPVIIFSTSSHLETIRETKEKGAYDFITKPDKFSDLVTVLRKLLIT